MLLLFHVLDLHLMLSALKVCACLSLVLILQGPSEDAVESAKTRIMILIDDAIARSPPTHFISIPVQSDQVLTNYASFVAACKASGTPAELLSEALSLHLTLGVLRLHGSDRMEQAKKALDEAAHRFSSMKPDGFEVRGLDYMNDDPSQVNVLFARVVDDERGKRYVVLFLRSL